LRADSSTHEAVLLEIRRHFADVGPRMYEPQPIEAVASMASGETVGTDMHPTDATWDLTHGQVTSPGRLAQPARQPIRL